MSKKKESTQYSIESPEGAIWWNKYRYASNAYKKNQTEWLHILFLCIKYVSICFSDVDVYLGIRSLKQDTVNVRCELTLSTCDRITQVRLSNQTSTASLFVPRVHRAASLWSFLSWFDEKNIFFFYRRGANKGRSDVDRMSPTGGQKRYIFFW